MIITGTTRIPKPGLLAEATLFTAGIVESMNSKFGVDFSLAIDVGGDPNAMHLVGRFDSMNDYQEIRAAYIADPEMTEQIKEGAELADITQDRIGEVVIPGDADAYAVINNLKAIYSNSSTYVLNGLDLNMNRGDRLALVGRSGSAKTTVSKAVMHLLPNRSVCDAEID